MTPFFSTPERLEKLRQVAATWEGTPFFAHACVKGEGVDCVRLAHAILHECGGVPPVDFPAYTIDHTHHADRSQLLPFLLNDPALAGRLRMVPLIQIQPGDIVACQVGHADHHLAVLLPDGYLIHALERAGVTLTHKTDTSLAKRALYAMRVMESKT
ncbi:MAG: C40 family peptidase [Opitutaceae bacterium]|jgi:cell wall-associated NlpC family hydrolase|nr:C40 family peptidase [Opitutaceae bacterium]